MALTPVNYEEGQLVNLPFSTGETVVKGGAVVADADGFYIMAGAATATDIYYIAMEAGTTTADGEEVLCVRLQNKVIIEADTDAAPARTDVGTVCDLATLSTVNPNAVLTTLFYIEDIVGPVGDLKVRGFFVDSGNA